MKEFVDKTSTASGTPINRATLMAIQGFVTESIVFNPDGSIVRTNDDGETLTTKFNADGSFTKTFVGQHTITITVSFDNNGNINKIIS